MEINAVPVTTGATYLDLMQAYCDAEWAKQKDIDYRRDLANAKTDTSKFNATTTLTQLFGSIQYGYLIQSAAEVYKHGRGEEYADIALELIRRVAEIFETVVNTCGLSEFDLDTLNFIEGAFAGGPFCKGSLILRQAGKMDDALYARMLPVWESTVRQIMRLPEWGPFNRCVLRMITLSRFARLYPDSAYAKEAGDMGRFLAEDSIGRWNMEDTPLYNGIWYICMAEYLHENKIRNFRTDTVFHYYATYLTHIQTPEGSLPDYGDARTREWGCAGLSIGFMEWAAVLYGDGDVKYAAMKYIDFVRQFYGPQTLVSGWMTRSYALAADMAETPVTPTLPHYLSGEVIEDLVGKKIVFRGENRDYLMVNYRDEGNYAVTARQNMYSTIPAPAEKIHHGHADENAIVELMYRDKFLLADGGYRDAIVTDGHYRADFYHNRIVARNGRMFREKGFLQYAENLGAYLKTETEKIFYHEMGGLEISRTRVDDPHHRVIADRTVIHLGDGRYLVADTVKATQTYEYTIGQMWFGGKIQKVGRSGKDFLVCQTLDCLRGPAGTEDLNLRLVMVNKELPTSIEKIRRNHTDDQYALSQYFTEYLGEGEYLHFVTLLLPEQTAADKAVNDRIAASAKCSQTGGGKALSISLKLDGKTVTIGFKMDEKFGFGDYKHRPTYTFEQGKYRVGPYETDALLAVFTQQNGKTDYSAIMLSRIDEVHGKKRGTVFASLPTRFTNNDLSVNDGAFCQCRRDGTIEG